VRFPDGQDTAEVRLARQGAVLGDEKGDVAMRRAIHGRGSAGEAREGRSLGMRRGRRGDAAGNTRQRFGGRDKRWAVIGDEKGPMLRFGGFGGRDKRGAVLGDEKGPRWRFGGQHTAEVRQARQARGGAWG
jgi:hypothetical protein